MTMNLLISHLCMILWMVSVNQLFLDTSLTGAPHTLNLPYHHHHLRHRLLHQALNLKQQIKRRIKNRMIQIFRIAM